MSKEVQYTREGNTITEGLSSVADALEPSLYHDTIIARLRSDLANSAPNVTSLQTIVSGNRATIDRLNEEKDELRAEVTSLTHTCRIAVWSAAFFFCTTFWLSIVLGAKIALGSGG